MTTATAMSLGLETPGPMSAGYEENQTVFKLTNNLDLEPLNSG